MSDHDHPVAANLVDQKFEATRPNQLWAGDTSELITGDGQLYLTDTLARPVSGRIGVWSKADSVVYVDDFTVRRSP